jgi:hypothetical protein
MYESALCILGKLVVDKCCYYGGQSKDIESIITVEKKNGS